MKWIITFIPQNDQLRIKHLSIICRSDKRDVKCKYFGQIKIWVKKVKYYLISSVSMATSCSQRSWTRATHRINALSLKTQFQSEEGEIVCYANLFRDSLPHPIHRSAAEVDNLQTHHTRHFPWTWMWNKRTTA